MPNLRRIAWLDMRVGQINDVRHSFDATNDATAAPVLREYSAIVRARDGKGEPAAAASSARPSPGKSYSNNSECVPARTKFTRLPSIA